MPNNKTLHHKYVLLLLQAGFFRCRMSEMASIAHVKQTCPILGRVLVALCGALNRIACKLWGCPASHLGTHCAFVVRMYFSSLKCPLNTVTGEGRG